MATANLVTHIPVRADGIEARQRLITAGLDLFSRQGFDGTSVREVAQAAQVNLASISYYFGDKAGLYRAVLTEPVASPQNIEPSFNAPGLNRQQRLQLFFDDFMAPLKQGEAVQKVIKLHYREMIEPTGVWHEIVDSEFRPSHDLMVRMLVAELGLRRADVDVQRLALAIVGLAVHYFTCQPVVARFAPQVVASSRSIDTLSARLAMYAEAMIRAEADRRKQAQESDHA